MDLTIGTFILLFIIGLTVSFLSAMVGIGGGIIFVPLFVAFYGLSVPEARTISLFCMVLVTLSATIGYYRYNCIDWKLGLVYDVFAIPGVLVGKWIVDILNFFLPNVLHIMVVVTLWTIASLILFQKNNKGSEDFCTVSVSLMNDEHQIQISKAKKWIYSLISSFFGSFFTGSVGVGGGTVYTSTMILMGLAPIISVATAEFSMIFTNTFGFLSSAIFPLLNWNVPGFETNSAPILWEFILPIGIASFIGSLLGTILSRRVKGRILKRMLAVVVILMGIPIILDIFGFWNF